MSDITPQQREQVERLFHSALKVERSERAAFVSRECAGDVWLLNELTSLLEAHENGKNFLEKFPHGYQPEQGSSLDHYEIIKLLGAGGMGKVYLARDRTLGRKVALKFLLTPHTDNQQLFARLLQEARVMSNLSHPNVCIVYEVAWTENNQPFIVFEYVEGETLCQRLARKRMKLPEVLEVAIQVALALTAGHQHGVVHRDIKPENIMLRRDGIIKVLDFGLAKLMKGQEFIPTEEADAPESAKTEPGAVMGTVDYMSPEQLRGHDSDPRTDIWSLGVVLYLMAANKHPFKGPTPVDTAAAIIRQEPATLSNDSRRVPAELDLIIRKALSKNRKERYKSVAKMAADLRRLQARQEPVNLLRRHWKKWSVAVAAALLVLTMLAYYFYSAQRDRIAANSIAVLPFIDDDPNSDTEYLSDGLTESLINDLSKFSNLRVTPLHTVSRYKGRDIDSQKIGSELKVQVLLVGRVARRGETMTVSIELIDVKDHRHLGSGQHHGKQSDLLFLQRRLSQEVFDHLQLSLKGFERRQSPPKYTDNAEAYRLYLQGRYFWNKRTEEGFKKSIEIFRQAIEKDPNFALPFVGLADAYFVLGQWSVDPLHEATRNARDALTRALELNERLAEAHVSLADIKVNYDYDWEGGKAEYLRAIELDPNNAYAHSNYAMYLSFTGQHDAAISEIERAQQLDPVSIYTNAAMSQVLFLARKYDLAIEQCRKSLEMDDSIGQHLTLGWAYEQKEMYDKAIEEFQKYHQLAGDPETLDVLGHAYAQAGNKLKAYSILEELKSHEKNPNVIIDPSAFALVYLGMGEKDKAFDFLDKAYKYRSPNLTLLKAHPYFDPYRSEPRFIELLHRVGFTK